MGVNFEPAKSSTKIKTEGVSFPDGSLFIRGHAFTDFDMMDLNEINHRIFDWAEGLDTKNWEQLRSILAPKFTADYTSVLGPGTLWADITPDAFVEHMKNTIGNPRLGTMHLVGVIKYDVVSETEILATVQMRPFHMLFEEDERKTMKLQSSGNGKMVNHYSLIEGEWKLSGMKPGKYWMEPDFEKVLA